MKNKTVTMDYNEHQGMLIELELLRETKLTVIKILNNNNGGYYSNNYNRFYTMDFKVDSTEELNLVIKKLIDDLRESVINPEKEKNVCLQEIIRKQEKDILELKERISKKKWYEFISMKEK